VVCSLSWEGFSDSLLQQMIVLCGYQKSKHDQSEVAQPLEDYTAYASSSATDNNKVISTTTTTTTTITTITVTTTRRLKIVA